MQEVSESHGSVFFRGVDHSERISPDLPLPREYTFLERILQRPLVSRYAPRVNAVDTVDADETLVCYGYVLIAKPMRKHMKPHAVTLLAARKQKL